MKVKVHGTLPRRRPRSPLPAETLCIVRSFIRLPQPFARSPSRLRRYAILDLHEKRRRRLRRIGAAGRQARPACLLAVSWLAALRTFSRARKWSPRFCGGMMTRGRVVHLESCQFCVTTVCMYTCEKYMLCACAARVRAFVLVLGECAFRLLVMCCVVDAGKRSEIGARKYTPSSARYCWRAHDAVVLLSDITTVGSVRLLFGIVDLESRACCICVSSGSHHL